MAGVRQAIADTLGSLFDSGRAEVTTTPQPAEGGGSSISAQVAAEVGKLRETERREREAAATTKSVGDRLAALETAVTEKPPKQHRKITSWLWGDE